MTPDHHDVPGDAPGTPGTPVPFAGLRRHARALVVGAALLVALFVLVPDITPRPTELPPVLLVHGRIVELLETTEPGVPDVRIEGPARRGWAST